MNGKVNLMRKVTLSVLALVVVLLLAAPLALGQGGTVEQQISALSDQFIQAQLKDDTSFFEKYLGDDATIIHSDGTIWTKAQEIANLKSGTLKPALFMKALRVVCGATRLRRT